MILFYDKQEECYFFWLCYFTSLWAIHIQKDTLFEFFILWQTVSNRDAFIKNQHFTFCKYSCTTVSNRDTIINIIFQLIHILYKQNNTHSTFGIRFLTQFFFSNIKRYLQLPKLSRYAGILNLIYLFYDSRCVLLWCVQHVLLWKRLWWKEYSISFSVVLYVKGYAGGYSRLKKKIKICWKLRSNYKSLWRDLTTKVYDVHNRSFLNLIDAGDIRAHGAR